MATWLSLESPIGRESQKQSGVEVNAWASWGAGVLRPYVIVLDGEVLGVLTSGILRFAEDDNARKWMGNFINLRIRQNHWLSW
jgi:hypothetical protein